MYYWENGDMHFWAVETRKTSGNKWGQSFPLLPAPAGLSMCDSRLIKPPSVSISYGHEPGQWQVISLLEKLQNCRCLLLTVNSERRLRCGSVWVIWEVVWPPWGEGGLLKVRDHSSLGSSSQSPQWGLQNQSGEGGGHSEGREGRSLRGRTTLPLTVHGETVTWTTLWLKTQYCTLNTKYGDERREIRWPVIIR